MHQDKNSSIAAETGRLAYKWKVLISVIFGIFMVILDTTVVNIAFRTLQTEFAASVNDSQWIISIYVLSLGISTPLSGYLGDRFGLKKIFLTGLSMFVIGSLLCGLAPNLWFLVGARMLQGIGGGIALPLGTAMLFAAFPPQEQGLALGFFGIALVVAPALGPILGGYLVDLHHWRWIFFINVPIGTLGVYLGWNFLQERRQPRVTSFDWPGLIASTIGFGSVLYASSVAANQGWGSSTVLIFFTIGTIALVAFALIELYLAKYPLLDLRLFKSIIFTNAAVVGWVSVLALFGAEFLMPLYLQVLRGRTALETGLILLPLAITAGITIPLAGRLYDKIGARPLVVIGFSILVINTWQLAQLTTETAIAWIIFLLVLRGLALGLTVQTTLVTALSTVPMPKLSRGSALINSTRQVVQSIAVAILATILASSISPGLNDKLETFEQNAPRIIQGAQSVELCQLPAVGPAALAAQAKKTVSEFCSEYITGLERAYKLTFYVAILATLLGAFLPGWPLRWTGRRAPAPEREMAASH
ncbi:MAG: DHA2 family efflux MFS transporter permease subunit [Anaerolineae bacterium]|nr:DHA2 family efflux MFS transporter permease subunit [Anaerolineae bacterium]